jgi:hypothetical protein
MNTTKVILKNVSIETELFLKVTDRTKGSGVYLIVLCTDTPDSQITFFNALKIKLPQVFFQPDVCHSTSLSLAMVATISEVESMLKDMWEINDFFLSSNFMICLLCRVSAERIGCPRTMMRPCKARVAQNCSLAVNVFSLRGVMEACVSDPAFA